MRLSRSWTAALLVLAWEGTGWAALGNETCSSASELGEPALPFAVEGSLDSTPVVLDVDYYRFAARPGETLAVEVSGPSWSGTSSATFPLLGFFDGDCNLIERAAGLGAARLTITVPGDGIVVVAVTSNDDWSFTGGGVGAYQLVVRRFEGSFGVTGQVVDANTGTPPWSYWLAYVVLYRCVFDDCDRLTYSAAAYLDYDGRFYIYSEFTGSPLEAGLYRLEVSADGYSTHSSIVSVDAGTWTDLGIIELAPVPAVRSISGRIVDAETMEVPAVPYWYWYYSQVILIRCLSADCTDYQWVSRSQPDPSSGRFTFTRTWWGLPLEAGDYRVAIEMPTYLPFESASFSAGLDEEVEMGDLALQPIPRIDSISGRIVDSLTSQPLGSAGAYVTLQSCSTVVGCVWVVTPVDAGGRFRFERDQYGAGLLAGNYWLSAFADQYQGRALEIVATTAAFDAGDIELTSNPIRFTDLSACENIPGSGGRCRFSVTLINGQEGVVNGSAWAEVEGNYIGSFVDFTRFTAGKQGIAFPSGSKGARQTLSFSFDVPATVRDYAWFCASIWFGQGSNAFLDTTGQRQLFCVQKNPRLSRFEVVSEREARELMKQSAEKLDPRPEPKRLYGNPPLPSRLPRGVPGIDPAIAPR